jgi:hypothetical protein
MFCDRSLRPLVRVPGVLGTPTGAGDNAGEYRRITKDGKQVWILASYNPIFDADGKPVKVVKFADRHHGPEAARRRDQGKLDAIGRSQAVIEFDLRGNVLSANENFLRTMGYAKTRWSASTTACSAKPSWSRARLPPLLGQPGPGPVPVRPLQAPRQARCRHLDPGHLQPDSRRQRQAVQGREIRDGRDRPGAPRGTDQRQGPRHLRVLASLSQSIAAIAAGSQQSADMAVQTRDPGSMRRPARCWRARKERSSRSRKRPTTSTRSSRRSATSPARPTCSPSMPRSRRRAPANTGRASRSSPTRCANWPRSRRWRRAKSRS